jgi:2-polyprenyl-3-methyl-5-hydroxy-6-metoxy-1,4-benzoquinol methylase
MSELANQYFCKFAAAFVRGHFATNFVRGHFATDDQKPANQSRQKSKQNKSGTVNLKERLGAEQTYLLSAPLEELSQAQLEELILLGKTCGLNLHKFKKTMGLARVQSVLGMLQNIQPENMLDLGSGRGVFIWPFLDAFPDVQLTCVDMSPIRVRDLNAVHAGGITQLSAVESDICDLKFEDHSFDVVTFLEALEHIQDTEKAIRSALRVSRRFLIISVPSHEDDNDEHIHLFDKDTIQTLLKKCGVNKMNFHYVLNHMIVLANLSS